MTEVLLKPQGEHKLSFVIEEGGVQIAEMVAGISGMVMTIFHTEVVPQYEGQGLAGKLFDAMVDYARKNRMTVKAKCPYVRSQFLQHPEKYGDVWKPDPA